jgi:uncharacterized protein (TIGR00251 family)
LDELARLDLAGTNGAARLVVRVVPRADRTGLDGLTDTGALRVRLTAPPVEGAANAALVTLLADMLALPKREITIVRGAHGREKVVQIHAPLEQIRERLRAAVNRARR